MKSKILKNKCNLFKSKASVHRRLLSFIFLCTFLLEPMDALANCEAGIHGIHTIAEYGSSNELGTFYMFVKRGVNFYKENDSMFIEKDGKKNDVKVAYLANTEMGNDDNVKAPDLGEKKVKVHYGKKSCFLKKKIVAGKVKGLQHRSIRTPIFARVFFEGCENIFDMMPRIGTLVVNATSGDIYLPVKLEINKKNKPNPDEVTEITNNIKKLIAQKKLAKGTIKNKNLMRTTVEITTVGNAAPSFRMGIGVLLLDNPFEVYPDLKNLNGIPEFYKVYYRDEISKDRLFEFPVLFFTNSENKFYYIGDGRACGDVSPYYRILTFIDNITPAKDNKYKKNSWEGMVEYKDVVDYPLGDKRFNLGPTERFVLTSAFDLTDDGYPDIIHVNESNVYAVLKNGKIIVINRFMPY